ncbi:MAG TPA: alpha/beta family hydrolase [Nitrososphaeraceae archaeon]|nr:alpha/beta family hydrolase [Nitrososphaeraceae archaeon]
MEKDGTLTGIMAEQQMKEHRVTILESLEGGLTIPLGAQAVVLFAHGSGSSRYSSRNRFVATVLNNNRIATLLVDLLSQDEKRIDEETKHLRYNIELLAGRFAEITNWLAQQPETRDLKIGYFGSSTGAAAALITASRVDAAKAIVTRGGRPDLAGESILHQVRASTLLIVGGNDTLAIEMNKRALESLSNTETKELAIIPGATHLFEEPGKMEEVAQTAADWFECYLLGISKKKFNNRYARISKRGYLSSLWDRHAFQIKFKDRFAAGEILSSTLGKYKNDQHGITVIGIARGGVIVADAIAEKLNADFDIIVPRRLRSPYNSENAIGAIMHDGSLYLDTSTLQTQNDISNEYIDMEKLEQKKEMERRLSMYRPYSREYKINDRTVILVDDGIATGATMIVAARWIRKQEPKQLIIAAPVAPKRAIEPLKNEVDQVEIIRKPSDLKAVEQFYQEFASVSDDQILQVAKRRFVS